MESFSSEARSQTFCSAMNHALACNEYVNVCRCISEDYAKQAKVPPWECSKSFQLTPNAEKRFRLGHDSCLLRKTSDLSRGGFFGRIITRDSSLMSSSSSLLSDETDNCLCTGPWSDVDQSADETRMKQIHANSMLSHNANTCKSRTLP